MSIFEQYKNSRQLWVITALVLVLLGCMGVLAWLTWGAPASAAPPEESSLSAPESPLPPPSKPSSEPPESSSVSESSSPASGSPLPSAPPSPPPPASSSGAGSVPVVPTPVSSTLTVSRAGTHDASGTYGSVTVSAAGVTLKNKTVSGDLTIAPAVGDGAVVLENITVKGKILVFGGKSILLNDVTAAALVAQRTGGTSDYQVKGASTIQTFTAKNRLTIDEGALDSGYAGVRNLVTAAGAPVWQEVTLLDGALDSITTTATTQLILESGTAVETLTAQAKTHIAGRGRVAKLVVRHDEVGYEREPGDVTVARGFADPVLKSWGIGESAPDDSDDDPVRLAAPFDLAITADGPQRVVLSFGAVPQAGGYSIRYTLTNGSTTVTQTVSSPSADYLLTHPLIGQAGSSLSFQARAVAASSRYSDSALSASKSALVTELVAPQNLRITPDGDGKFRLSFDAVDGAEGYAVTPYIGETAQDILPLAADVYTCIFDARYDEIAAETSYRFAVAALGNGALTLDSPASTSAAHTVTPLSAPEGLAIAAGADDRAGRAVFSFAATAGSEYHVAASYDEAELTLSAGENCTVSSSGIVTALADGTAVLLADAPDPIEAGRAYLLTVTARGDGQTTLDSTASLTATVGRRATPAGLSITSAARRSVLFGFAGLAGVEYEVAASLDGSPLELIDGAALLETDTALGQLFALTVRARGDGVLTLDSDIASQSAAVAALAAPGAGAIALSDSGRPTLGFAPTQQAASHRLIPSVQSGEVWQEQAAVTSFTGDTAGRLETEFTLPAGATGLDFSVQALSGSALWTDSAPASPGEIAVTTHAAPTGLAMASGGTTPASVIFSFEKPSSSPVETVCDLTYTAGGQSHTVENVPVSRAVPSLDIASVTGFSVALRAILSEDVLYLPNSHAALPLAAPVIGENPVTDTTVPNPAYTDGSGLPETLDALQFAFGALPNAQSYTLTYTLTGGQSHTQAAVAALPFVVVTDEFAAADVTGFTVSANRYTAGGTTYLASPAAVWSAAP
jgi:hypothetical protein